VLNNPEVKELRALVNLSDNPDFNIILNWFENSLLDTRKRNDKQRDDILLRMEQGSAVTMNGLLDHSVTAIDELNKLTK